MEKKYKRFTKEEDEIIFRAVLENPLNKSKCFVALASKLGRNSQAISNRWYNQLSNPLSKAYMGIATIVISNKAMAVNRTKEPCIDTTVKVKKSFWTKILKFLGLR